MSYIRRNEEGEERSLTAECRKKLVVELQKLSRKFTVEPGLTTQELSMAEEMYGIQFPPDLRFLLRWCLPVSPKFPNWRQDNALLRDQLSWPSEGILFDVEYKSYWREEWGERPYSLEAAKELALTKLHSVPKLVPVFAHCYLPGRPCVPGNPVFSVYQTDVIHRGRSLADYLAWLCYDGDKVELERDFPAYSPSYRHITFWTELTRENFG